MATAHILPGYGNPVSRLKRAHSAYPLDKQKMREYIEKNADPEFGKELDAIRNKSRQMWTSVDREPTTYNSFHSPKYLDEPTRPLPSEPGRKHKPHPPLVFLTNRLHYVPGFHNPDAAVGKEVYQVDASLHHEGQAQRKGYGQKYVSRPKTAAVMQYEDRYPELGELKESLDPVTAQGAEAWMKLADDKDHHLVFSAIDKFQEQRLNEESQDNKYSTVMPSIHRWMHYAGKRETNDLHHHPDLPPGYSYHLPSTMRPLHYSAGTVQQRRAHDIENMKKSRYVHKPIRGDFLIHPEWPPTLPHHKV
ncbi:hypothetical protein CHS0354_041957 [Potamilus streckersoni]|uniref:Uncharacterized protein n=1 Tax=Potamilus streckersoni TaxID=2493646 RepID=A0AAE0TAR8_9BIVA|nr:hypothetical protein CHS0354_041957 [Potamilus streckersoni]